MNRPSPLEDAFASTIMELATLRRTDVDLPGLRHHTNAIDFAIGRLCDALALPDGEDIKELAHRAYRAVLAIGQLLDSADSDDRRTRDTLDLTRDAVATLLNELDPLVSRADRALRDVLLRGQPLDEPRTTRQRFRSPSRPRRRTAAA